MTILVIDLGSSSVRGLLFDSQARAVAGAQVSIRHQFDLLPPGASTIDAEMLRTNVETCIDQLLQHPRTGEIRAVGMDTFAGNILGIDQNNTALTPVYTYGDTRSADDVALLKAIVDPPLLHQRTGTFLHTAYLPGRLHWLRRTENSLFQQVHQWVDFGSYLYRQWFGGDVPTSLSVASWNGLLNRSSTAWDQPLLESLGLSSAVLPPVADYTAAQRGLNPTYAQRWPALRNVPFFLAVGDGAAANIGSGCVDERALALSMGTTAALRLAVRQGVEVPVVPAGLWSYRISAQQHLLGGATSEGGNIYQWARRTFQVEQLGALDDVLLSRQADGHGLTMLPLLAGERSPGWRADAVGAVVGLRLSTTPLDLLQAAMESVALRLALVAGQLQPLSAVNVGVVASGGALTRSQAWIQMIADALNRPIAPAVEPEITARGTALLALQVLDGLDPALHPPQLETAVQPRPEAVTRMQAALQRQIALYNTLYPGDTV
ncbi:MAG: gluconokinase [bacterium]|nr:gluconokinase [bacterium]